MSRYPPVSPTAAKLAFAAWLGRRDPEFQRYLLLLASFTAPDGTLLAAYTPESGPAGVAADGALDIQTNQLHVSGPGVILTAGVFDVGFADVTISGSVKVNAASNTGLIGRWLDNGNFWWARVVGVGEFQLLERTGGFWFFRATTPVALVTNTFHDLTLTFAADSITATLDGGNALAYTSAVGWTRTRHGVGGDDGADRYDLLQITSP